MSLNPVRTENEAREKGRKGGIASGIARRKKRDMRLALLALMDSVENGQTGTERIALALFNKALEGDLKAIAMCDAMTMEGNNMENKIEAGLDFLL